VHENSLATNETHTTRQANNAMAFLALCLIWTLAGEVVDFRVRSLSQPLTYSMRYAGRLTEKYWKHRHYKFFYWQNTYIHADRRRKRIYFQLFQLRTHTITPVQQHVHLVGLCVCSIVASVQMNKRMWVLTSCLVSSN